MAKKPPQRRRDGEPVSAVGCLIPKALFDRLTKDVEPGLERQRLYDRVIRTFIAARNDGSIPRAYIGTRKADRTQQSIYVTQEIADALEAIAGDDGQSKSTVIRTAMAWYVFGKKATEDPWETDTIFGMRRRIEVKMPTAGCQGAKAHA